MAEPCTRCGFSPLGDQVPDEVPASEPVPLPPGDAGAPETTGKPNRKGLITSILWAAVGFAIWIAIQSFDGFESPTGPDADEAESALVASAAGLGVSVNAECPDDSEDTDVGDSFECVVTSIDGDQITLTVDNNEDDFTWRTAPLGRLGN